MAGSDFPTFAWIYESGKFWTKARNKGNNVKTETKDLDTIRVVSKAYLDEMKA